MFTIILCCIVIVICIGAVAVLCKMYYDLNLRYNDVLDTLDDATNENRDPDITALTIKYLKRKVWQTNRANKMLFELLLDLLEEEDEGEAICRLIDLRYKIMHMNISNSNYVREAYRRVDIRKDRKLNTIMCWLCSILDVREGKENLSVLARKEYNDSRDYVVDLQKQLISIKDDIKKEQEKEEYYEEPSYDDNIPGYTDVYDKDESSLYPSVIKEVWFNKAS